MDYDSITDRFHARERAWIARRRQAWAVRAIAPSPGTARVLPRRFPWVLMILGLGMILGAILETGIAVAQQLQLSPQAMQQLQILHDEKVSRTLAQQKMKSNLVLEMKMRRDTAIRRAMPALQTNITLDTEDKTLVDITAEVTAEVLQEIEQLGGEVINSFPQYRAIRALMPIGQLEALARLPQVDSIRPADQAMNHVVNVSQGDVAQRANTARATFGVTGAGVSICVLSDSVDHLAEVQATGDLPGVTVLPGQAGSGNGEGTAMLEIVHDLAPGAALGFATANGGQAQFAQNILNLRNILGCHVIVDDVGYFAEPAFQDGIIAQAVNAVVTSGALYFSSAGNGGNSNDGRSGVWEGDFVPGNTVQGLGLTHNFRPGVNVNTITFPTNVITLQWSDPWGSSANDYDLYLFNPSLTQLVAFSNATQNGTGNPFEQITLGFNPVGFGLVIAKFGGADRFLRLNTHINGSTPNGGLAIATPGQTWGHSAAVGAFSIAAVNVATAGGGVFVGGAANPVEIFSSDGPRRIFFNANGTPITPGNLSSTGGTLRQKPDFAAADGVTTATPGFNPFFGTSAAAPHAAAIGGLVLSAHPTFTPAQVRQALIGSALNIEGPGWDRDAGFGIINAFVAINAFAGTGRVLHNFNSDARADLLWRHSPTGTVFMWLMNGATVGQYSEVATVSDLGWQISGGGDVNGDNTADVVWHHNVTGEVAVWLMNGPVLLQAAIVAQVADLNWRIAGVGDLNGDGKADLVWHHSVTGQVVVWLMNGLGILQIASVAQVDDLGWQLQR